MVVVSQGNPWRSSYGFCLRDNGGDMIYAQERKIGEEINMIAETTTIKEVMNQCYAHGLQQVTTETRHFGTPKHHMLGSTMGSSRHNGSNQIDNAITISKS